MAIINFLIELIRYAHSRWYLIVPLNPEVWLVYVNESTQIERLMNRNGFTKEDALARIKSQMRLDDKRPYADVIIDNNGTPLDLKEQLDTIWNERIESAL